MNSELKKRIGIFFGSFNPIHLGHVAFAKYCIGRYGLDLIVFVPANSGYSKFSCGLADGEDRVRMCELALEGIPGVCVSRLETDGIGTKYTVDTVRALKALYSPTETFLLMGCDLASGIGHWYCADELMSQNRFIVAARKDFPCDLPPELLCRCSFAEYEALDISSTQIRKDLKEGREPKGLHIKVREYIDQRGLYNCP